MEEYIMIAIFVTICALAFSRWAKSRVTVKHYAAVPGEYLIGRNIPAGKYDLVAQSGTGDFCILRKNAIDWEPAQKLGFDSDSHPRRFRNLTLNKGDLLQINGSLELETRTPAPVKTIATEPLEPGNYKIGTDLLPGIYDLKVLQGEGQVYTRKKGEEEHLFFQKMAKDKGKDGVASEYHNLRCDDGVELRIRDNLKLHFTNAPNTPRWHWLF